MGVYEKLKTVQHQLKAPKGQKNDFGGYRYRSCEDIVEAVKPLLYSNQLVLTLTDEVVEMGSRYYVKSTAKIYDTDSNENLITTAFAREEENKKGQDSAQITGAASSYARKYALNGLFAIDDTKDPDATNIVKCTDCGKEITSHGKITGKQISDGTAKTYGKPLCFSCVQKYKQKNKCEKKG